MERYEIVKDLGSGASGIARLVRDKCTGEHFAVKFIERGKKIDEHVQGEIMNHRSLKHPNIVQFKEGQEILPPRAVASGTMEKSKIQILYEACRVIFSPQKELPTYKEIHWLKNLLGSFEAIDFGIDEHSLSGSPSPSPKSEKGLICAQNISQITYIHVYECEQFSIGVFCFPAGGMFPLHDHPEMTVFSKLLYGSCYVKAYDWVKVETSHCLPTFGLGGKVLDGIMSAPCETSVLFPRSGGNIHSFTALTPCAILDVLTPPYSEELGRPSTYFTEFPIPSLPGYAILGEQDLPDDLVVEGAPYLGPPIEADDDDNDDHC